MAQVPTRGISPPGSRQPGVPLSGSIMANPNNPNWRKRLQRASFKGVSFYVEQQGRSSGRRTVVFEYPKRDIPYAEDMGRHAIRYQMTGYLIQAPRKTNATGDTDIQYGPMWRDYDQQRDLLEAALMSPGPGVLQDPYNPRLAWTGYGNAPPMFMCERYSIIEQREKGGFCMLEMSFVEAGIPGNNVQDAFSVAAVNQIVATLLLAAARQLNQQQSVANDPNAVSDQQRLNDAFDQFKSSEAQAQ